MIPGKETGALLHAPKAETSHRTYSDCDHSATRVEWMPEGHIQRVVDQLCATYLEGMAL